MSTTTTPPSLSPDAFSPLPELSTILSRLRPPPSSSSNLNPLASPGGGPASQPTPSAATPLPSGGSTASPTTGPISLKEVPLATDPIKHRLQRARQQVKALPDVGRTVAEQEREIDELQGRIRRQKEVLRVLREVGIRFGVGDEGGGGGEARKEEGGEHDKQGVDMDMVMR